MDLKEEEKAHKRTAEINQEKRRFFFGQSKSVTNLSKQTPIHNLVQLPKLKSKDKIRRIASNLDEKEKEMVEIKKLNFRLPSALCSSLPRTTRFSTIIC